MIGSSICCQNKGLLSLEYRVTRSGSFNRSSCDFFGIISSMCGARSGYVSIILVRMALWTDDLTLDLDPALSLKDILDLDTKNYTRNGGIC